MAKKRKRKQIGYYIKTLLLIFFIGLFSRGTINELKITMDLLKEYTKTSEEYDNIKNKMDYMSNKKEMLQNDNYLTVYAQGKYYMTKEKTDQIFVIGSKK